jgi:hypothetical protein
MTAAHNVVIAGEVPRCFSTWRLINISRKYFLQFFNSKKYLLEKIYKEPLYLTEIGEEDAT